MKKILGSAILLSFGLFLFGCSGTKSVNSNFNGEKIDKSESIENISTISIDSGVSEVNIEAYNGNEVKVEGKLGRYSKGLNISKNGNELVIKEDSKSFNTSLFNDDEYTKLDIFIPKSFSGDLRFDQGAGVSEIKDIEVNNLKINGGAGKIVAENISFKNMDLDSGVGEINIITGENSGNIKIDGGVGELNLEITKVGGNLSYDGGVGSANIKIPKNSPVRFESESGLGKAKIDAITSNEGTYKFDLKVGVGSIKVYN